MKKLKLNKWDRIEIVWIDSIHASGWTHEDEISTDEKEIETWMTQNTLGYLLHDAKNFIGVVQSISSEKDNRSVDAIMRIPKIAIKSITKYEKDTSRVHARKHSKRSSR